MRSAVLFLLPALALAADWNPRAAADHLDGRQQEWFAWPGANANAKPCVSCHGGLPYLLARPALRRVLHESEPTRYETGLLASLGKVVPYTGTHGAEAAGVQAILAAFFLRTPEAIARMRSLQTESGAYPWFSLNLEPWEQPKSAYFGAALAYLADPNDRTRAYLVRELDSQPLHHKLMAVWSGALPAETRDAVLDQLWRAQSADGSWTLDALGPWIKQPASPPADIPSTYATGFAAAVLHKAGVRDPHIGRALAWLRTHQSDHGYFYAVSMNKRRPETTIEFGFMREAATAWAALALAEEFR